MHPQMPLTATSTRVFSLSVQNSETAPRVAAKVPAVLMPSSRAFPDPHHRLYEQRRSRHRHHELLRINIPNRILDEASDGMHGSSTSLQVWLREDTLRAHLSSSITKPTPCFFSMQNQADETFPSKFQPRNSDVIFMSSQHDAPESNLLVATRGDRFIAYGPPRPVN
jgi:hypothetical protein